MGAGVTLALGDNVTLVGRNIARVDANNNNHLVRVNNGGTLRMETGSMITGNTNAVAGTTVAANEAGGGAIRVNNGGTFVMNGGTISGNIATNTNTALANAGHGGGVRVESGGAFEMRGGTISNNEGQFGGGVFVAPTATFRMIGGVIYGNDAEPELANRSRGGGANASAAVHGAVLAFDNEGANLGAVGIGAIHPTMRAINGVVQGFEGTIAEQLAWLRIFSANNREYVMELSGDHELAPTTADTGGGQLLPTGRTGLTITIVGTDDDEPSYVSLSANGTLFRVPPGVRLEIGENVTLVGRRADGPAGENNTGNFVHVLNGGTFVMNEGSRLTGNAGTGGAVVIPSGGVNISGGGRFDMFGGTISGNTSVQNGGGVFVARTTTTPITFGTFNMRGGEIRGNEAGWNGGGVRNEGNFLISDGIIHGRDAAAGLANTVGTNGGALSHVTANSIAQFGTFNEFGAFSQNGAFLVGTNANHTVHVEDGELLSTLPADTDIADSLDWLRAFARNNREYVIELGGDHELAPTTADTGGGQLLPTGRTGLTITIVGTDDDEPSNVSLSANGNLFRVPPGGRLEIGENVTLVGRREDGPAGENNNASLVNLLNGGTFVMNVGARLTGNIGTGVNVANGGVFILDGGEVSGNTTTDNGGGVHVANGGRLDMLAGTIFGNTANQGGGVNIASGGMFRMGMGIVFGNETAVDVNLRNNANAGAALNNAGTAQYGTFFDAGVFAFSGTLTTTNNTIAFGDPITITVAGLVFPQGATSADIRVMQGIESVAIGSAAPSTELFTLMNDRGEWAPFRIPGTYEIRLLFTDDDWNIIGVYRVPSTWLAPGGNEIAFATFVPVLPITVTLTGIPGDQAGNIAQLGFMAPGNLDDVIGSNEIVMTSPATTFTVQGLIPGTYDVLMVVMDADTWAITGIRSANSVTITAPGTSLAWDDLAEMPLTTVTITGIPSGYEEFFANVMVGNLATMNIVAAGWGQVFGGSITAFLGDIGTGMPIDVSGTHGVALMLENPNDWNDVSDFAASSISITAQQNTEIPWGSFAPMARGFSADPGRSRQAPAFAPVFGARRR